MFRRYESNSVACFVRGAMYLLIRFNLILLACFCVFVIPSESVSCGSSHFAFSGRFDVLWQPVAPRRRRRPGVSVLLPCGCCRLLLRGVPHDLRLAPTSMSIPSSSLHSWPRVELVSQSALFWVDGAAWQLSLRVLWMAYTP